MVHLKVRPVILSVCGVDSKARSKNLSVCMVNLKTRSVILCVCVCEVDIYIIIFFGFMKVSTKAATKNPKLCRVVQTVCSLGLSSISILWFEFLRYLHDSRVFIQVQNIVVVGVPCFLLVVLVQGYRLLLQLQGQGYPVSPVNKSFPFSLALISECFVCRQEKKEEFSIDEFRGRVVSLRIWLRTLY